MKKLVFVVVLLCSVAQVTQRCTAGSPPLSPAWALYFHWTREKLTGDDKPFQDIQRDIDSMIAAGKNKVELAQKFKLAAQGKPSDAQAQFRWAYATYKAIAPEQDRITQEKLTQGIYEAMAVPPSPRSYEYTRIRYLVATLDEVQGSNGYVIELGKRLALSHPKDYELKYHLTRSLVASPIVSDRRTLAVRYAWEVQKALPIRASSYALLGWVYSNNFSGLKQSKLADQAIAFYRKYLALAPPSYKFRATAAGMIRGIEHERAYYARKGMLKS